MNYPFKQVHDTLRYQLIVRPEQKSVWTFFLCVLVSGKISEARVAFQHRFLRSQSVAEAGFHFHGIILSPCKTMAPVEALIPSMGREEQAF